MLAPRETAAKVALDEHRSIGKPSSSYRTLCLLLHQVHYIVFPKYIWRLYQSVFNYFHVICFPQVIEDELVNALAIFWKYNIMYLVQEETESLVRKRWLTYRTIFMHRCDFCSCLPSTFIGKDFLDIHKGLPIVAYSLASTYLYTFKLPSYVR